MEVAKIAFKTFTHYKCGVLQNVIKKIFSAISTLQKYLNQIHKEI